MTTKVQFETREFERSHCRKPSAKAVGTWAFRFDRGDEDFWVNNATFAQAKAAARTEAQRRGATVARVQP